MFRIERAAVLIAVLGLICVNFAKADSQSFVTGNGLFRACDEALIEHRAQAFPCSFIVNFDEKASERDRSEALNQGRIVNAHRFARLKANEVVLNDRQDYLALRASAAVQDLIPNRLVMALGKPQPITTTQTTPINIVRIGATPAARGSIDGAGVGIAILDTGIDLANADLRVSSNCFSSYSSCQDGNGHGTHVSGIAAALDNNSGVIGVAPGATLYAVKVLDNSGNGSDATIMQGLEWILNNANNVNPAIRVVNASLGRTGVLDDNPPLRSLIASLKAAGIALVVSAGNDYSQEVSQIIPAGYPEVIAVGSTSAAAGAKSACRTLPLTIARDVASYFTTDGALDAQGIGVTISAPGEESENISKTCTLSSVGILSLARGGGTTRMSGTSMAAPHVSGAIALFLQQNAGLVDVDTIKARLRATSTLSSVAPYDAVNAGYSFDGEREGVLSVCALLGKTCL